MQSTQSIINTNNKMYIMQNILSYKDYLSTNC